MRQTGKPEHSWMNPVFLGKWYQRYPQKEQPLKPSSVLVLLEKGNCTCVQELEDFHLLRPPVGDGNSTKGGFAAQKTQTSYFGGLKCVFLTL